MRTIVFLILFLVFNLSLYSQEESRIQSIKNQLEVLAVDNTGLTEVLKLEINVTNVSLSNFLIGISKVHNINMNVDPALDAIKIVNNFSNVTVADLLVFLSKKYQLHIDFTGNILSISPYTPPAEKPLEKEISLAYDPVDRRISLDLKNDPLEKVFRKITDASGRNLLFASGMETLPLTLYLKEVDFDKAMKHLAMTNNLSFSKSRDGFYLFNTAYSPAQTQQASKGKPGQSRPTRLARQTDFSYQVTDTTAMRLNVAFSHTPISTIIHEIGTALKLNIYTATPLEHAGTITFTAKNITFDELLLKMFESRQHTVSHIPDNAGSVSQPNGNTIAFTFKKEGSIYFFGTEDQLSVRTIEIIPLMHRAIELLGDPSLSSGRTAGRTVQGNSGYINSPQNTLNTNAINTGRASIKTRSGNFNTHSNKAEALVNILPDDVIANLDIKIDFELNSFIVSGPATNINRFKTFVKEIDKPVPVILIEVMLLEVSRTATLEAGISWGIAEEPTTTKGNLFPSTDFTLGAKTVNKVIGGFNGFGSFNIGKVIPEFFASIKAMEANGNVKVRSTPKLSTLNGHRANLSIGETTYYVVTNQNFYGSQIPQSSEIRNYEPIDAELAINIKPLVSGDGQITLDINVIQSDFNGERIDEDAPPGINSREFSSIIRVRDQDLVVLGGLEEKIKNDSGSGVPFLARIPVIKWLFSKRKREDSKRKLTVLIKPTVIY